MKNAIKTMKILEPRNQIEFDMNCNITYDFSNVSEFFKDIGESDDK